MARNFTRLTVMVTALLSSTACTATTASTQPQPVTALAAAYTGPAPVLINPGYKPGAVDFGVKPVPGLQSLQEVVAPPIDPAASEEDVLRLPALQRAAEKYGMQGGLVWAANEINKDLEANADKLSRTYAFNLFTIEGPGGSKIMPPVIAQASDDFESFEQGKAIRVADTVFEIIEQAKFAPVAPLWHSYLMRNFTAPMEPMILPKNNAERNVWRHFVAKGWEAGVAQAHEIFQADLRRLERDFTGMVLYRQLLAKGMISSPSVSEGHLGVTGNNNNMRINDRALRITRDPALQLDTKKWQAPVSPTNPHISAQPPGGRVDQKKVQDQVVIMGPAKSNVPTDAKPSDAKPADAWDNIPEAPMAGQSTLQQEVDARLRGAIAVTPKGVVDADGVWRPGAPVTPAADSKAQLVQVSAPNAPVLRATPKSEAKPIFEMAPSPTPAKPADPTEPDASEPAKYTPRASKFTWQGQ